MFYNLDRSLMIKMYFTLTTLCLLALPVFGQTSLIPGKTYHVDPWFPNYANSGAFDFSDTLFYLNDGDTIHMLDISSGISLRKFIVPEEYAAVSYATFLTISPDGRSIWAGYTSDGALDDRIYCVDVETGVWEQKATFPGNMDLLFWNDSILVSGLNSTSWDAPAAVFVLDTSGANRHRRIIEPGGYSAGMALDLQNNLYYGTSYAMEPNALYRWDNSLIQPVIQVPGTPFLQVTQAEKLTDLPGGAYDCEVDEGGNVLFNMNLYGGTMAVCKWNGITGSGQHIDTLATASGEWDWLGNLKSKGDIDLTEPGNMVVTYSFGQPLALLTHVNTAGVRNEPVPEILVYPNPSEGVFTIGTESMESLDVRVYTLLGSLVYINGEFTSGEQIDLSSRAGGFYMLRVHSNKGTACTMIQKN